MSYTERRRGHCYGGTIRRAKNENGLNIDLIELEERLTPNAKFANRPEFHTVLKSDITKRQWGEKD